MSNTSNLDLERPIKGADEWHTSLNLNMTKIDSVVGSNTSSISDLPQVYIETGTLNYTTGDTITLPVAVDAINEYSVEITLTTGGGTDPEIIWVEKTTTNFVVKCTGNNTTDTFDAVIYYIGDIASYGGSVYRKWYVSTDAAITDHGDDTDTGSFAWVLDQISTTPSTVEMPGNKTYTITTSTGVVSTVNVTAQKGAIWDGAGTLTFDNTDQIDAGSQQQIFGSSITVVFTNGGTAYIGWFDNLTQAIASGANIKFESDISVVTLTIPSTTSLEVERGAVITVTGTLTINGPLIAGRYQIFNCTGSGLVTSNPSIDEIYPEWFGAVVDNESAAAANYTAIRLALKMALSHPYTTGTGAPLYNQANLSFSSGDWWITGKHIAKGVLRDISEPK